MAANLLSELEKLERGLLAAGERMRELEARIRELEKENAGLRRQTQEAEALRDRALLDCEYLEVSHRLADNPESLVEARRHISGLIRNIDRCLEMLRE